MHYYSNYKLCIKSYQNFISYLDTLISHDEKYHEHSSTIVTRKKNNKSSHGKICTICIYSSVHQMDTNFFRHAYETKIEFYKYSQIFLNKLTIYHN